MQITRTTPARLIILQFLQIALTEALTLILITPNFTAKFIKSWSNQTLLKKISSVTTRIEMTSYGLEPEQQSP